MSIPTLKKQASGTVLMLHDKPYIMLAGEVGNSNSSSVEYMEGVWANCRATRHEYPAVANHMGPGRARGRTV